MNNEIFFDLDGNDLFLDFMLEEYEFVPIFYICKDAGGKRYAVLCTDVDEEAYAIVSISVLQLNDMLQGALDIRSLFLLQQDFWNVQCNSDSYTDDTVEKKSIKDFPADVLPEAGVKYKFFDEEHAKYARSIQEELHKQYEQIPVREVDSSSIHETDHVDVSNVEFVEVIGSFSNDKPKSQRYSVGHDEVIAA